MLRDVTFYVYFIFVLLIAYIVIKSRSDNIIIQVLIIVVFVGLAGFRDLEVPDTPAYYSIYNSYNEDILDGQYIGQEIGFVAFGKLIRNIWDHHVLYFGLIALLNMLLIRQALTNLKVNRCLGMLAYISFFGLYVNFIVLRVGMSMSLFIYFFSLCQKGRWLLGSPILALAPLFHKSIALAMLVLPIMKFQGRRGTYLGLLIASLLFYFSGLSGFIINKTFDLIKVVPYLSKYFYYIDNIKYTNGFSVRHIFNMLVMIVVVSWTTELDKIKPMLNICILGIVLTSLLSNFLWVDRITDALVIFNIIILSVFALEKNSKVTNGFNELIFYLFLIFNMFFVSRIMTLFIFQDVI